MIRCMRTTLTIEPDVAAEIERRRRKSNRGLKGEINYLLRLGLEKERDQTNQHPTFKTKRIDLGELKLTSLESVSDALLQTEGETHS